MIISKDWTDYKILDAGFGEKVECWGNYTLRRPDPQILWPWQKHTKIRNTVDAHYHRSSKGGGSWEYINKIVITSYSIHYTKLYDICVLVVS